MAWLPNWIANAFDLFKASAATSVQSGRSPCATMDTHNAAMTLDADYRARFKAYENRLHAWIKMAPLVTPVLKIPVIVHIVGTKKGPAFTDPQVADRLNVLNACFNEDNDTSLVPAKWRQHIGQARLEFVLPAKGPDSAPVKAIRRTHTHKVQFAKGVHAEEVKVASPPEDTDKYLNVWVCNFDANGHATFPAAPKDVIQGVVVHYECFGKDAGNRYTGLGHTLVHEVGHWLGLFHLWGDEETHSGDDLVSDTPAQPRQHDEPTSPHPCGCDWKAPDAANHMFMNFMDYTPDDIRCFFTKEQVVRMRTALVKERPGVLWANHS